MSKNSSINLVAGKITLVDAFLNWALSKGRIVVIATEIIALAAFLYRFSLDRRLIDLHSKIKQEQAVLTYLKDNETTFRNLQNRLSLASKFSKEGKEKIEILENIISFSSNVALNNIGVSPDKIKIDANGRSVNDISVFVGKIKNYSRVASVSLDKIENRPSAATIDVGLTINLKPL